jgi:hypothetical protein
VLTVGVANPKLRSALQRRDAAAGSSNPCGREIGAVANASRPSCVNKGLRVHVLMAVPRIGEQPSGRSLGALRILILWLSLGQLRDAVILGLSAVVCAVGKGVPSCALCASDEAHFMSLRLDKACSSNAMK